MKISQVTVAFKKTVSDGNYGNESAELTYIVDIADGEDAQFLSQIVLSAARSHVLNELRQSGALNIRRALLPQVRKCNRCAAPLPDEERGYMHAACAEADRAEHMATRSQEAQAELEDIPF